MTTPAQLRKAALGLPEVTEGTHFGMPAFSVAGRSFASLTADGVAQLRLPSERVEQALAEHPAATPVTRGEVLIGCAVPLADINGMHLNNLVLAAWRHRAPKRLLAQSERVDDHDLPTAIGRPATGALLLAGIRSLQEVAARTDEELLALHGVGPRAVALLREAIAAR